ncbi:MAG: DUF4135 domain-containing protein [Magnetospirillum sp. WYHS-4]
MQAVPHHQARDRIDRFWACPVNIHGLDQECVERLIDEELFDLLQPTRAVANDTELPFQARRERGPLFFGDLGEVVNHRVRALTAFLREVRLSTEVAFPIGGQHSPLKFRSLAGDSHNGGRRPLVIEAKPHPWVLKFADPRPYQLLAEVLAELSAAIGIDLVPPDIVADPDRQWYFIPFLKTDGQNGRDPSAFMFALGAVTAVAYALRMVDLHLENLFVFEGKPIIVDPECVLYNFPTDRRQDRLLSTGLLSHNPVLSALRGGDVSMQGIVQLGLYERADGILDYHKPATAFHNRLRRPDGGLVDPADYRNDLFGGFTAAFKWFLGSRALLSDIIDRWVADDFRIRFLVRKTRLYITTIHMLNLPVSCRYGLWRDGVFERFRHAGHFLEHVSDDLVAAELADMEGRDVPYFWANAGETVIRHRRGPVQPLRARRPAREQAILDIHAMRRSDLSEQLMVLADFLDARLEAPVNDD